MQKYKDFQLSENFKFSELIKTRSKCYNMPPMELMPNAMQLITNVLQPLRNLLLTPIIPNSGYRSQIVNVAVNGSPCSQHLTFQAVDFKCENMSLAFGIIRDLLVFDQLIWEGGNDISPEWIHVSYVWQRDNRKQIIFNKNSTVGIPFV